MVLHLLLRAAAHAAADAASESRRAPNYGAIVQTSRRLRGGSLFEGAWKVGTGPHGNGRMTLKSGAIYEGMWH